MNDKVKNRKDVIKEVAYQLGYTYKDVEEILLMEDQVKQAMLQSGYSIKEGKNWKLKIETKKEKIGWDGINKKHFTIPEKKVLTFIPLINTKKSMELLNKNYENNN